MSRKALDWDVNTICFDGVKCSEEVAWCELARHAGTTPLVHRKALYNAAMSWAAGAEDYAKRVISPEYAQAALRAACNVRQAWAGVSL